MRKIICFITAVMLCLSVWVPVMAASAEVVSVNKESGEILCTLGEIDITFSDDINEEILSDLTFKKADGSEIKGGAYAIKGENDKQAKVKFGRLEEGDYVLEFAGTTLREYTVDTAEDTPVSADNFESIDLGNTDKDALTSNATNITFTGPDNSHKYTMEKTESGDKYLYYTCAGSQGVGGSFTAMLPTAIEEGKVIVDVTVKSDGVTMTRNILCPQNSAKKRVYTFSISTGNTLNCATQGVYNDSAYFTGADKKKDDEGFWNLRLVMSRETVGKNWDYMIYDRTTSLVNPIYKISIPHDTLNDLKGIVVFDAWNTTNNDAGVMVKEIVVTMPRVPSIIYTDGENGVPYKEEIKFVCNEDLISDSVTEERVFFVDGNGDELESDISYDEDTRAITVKPIENLKYGSEYSLVFNEQLCNNITFKTGLPEITFENAEYSVTDKEIIVDITNDTGNKKSAVVLVAVCNDAGTIQFFCKKKVEDDKDMTARVDLSEKVLPNSGIFKVYVWQQCDGFVRAISDIKTIEF